MEDAFPQRPVSSGADLDASKPSSSARGEPSALRCCFLSDLHLLASRSNANQYREALAIAAAGADIFVLGGDIFDFTWSRSESHERSFDHAAGWLEGLLLACPVCRFVYVLGNHDHHDGFIERLEELAALHPMFEWRSDYYRVGDTVFLHGDVADRKMTAEKLARARHRWGRKRRKGKFANAVYDWAVYTQLHKPVPYLNYRRLCSRRILAYLESIGEGVSTGLRHVYFGHIHRPFIHYYYRGVGFHNSGAALKGLKSRILETQIRTG